MNRAARIAEVDAAIARLQALKEDLEKDEPTKAESPYCTPAEYADWARVHIETVRRWILDGMPALDVKRDGEGRVVGTHKSTRIHREQADEWRRTR